MNSKHLAASLSTPLSSSGHANSHNRRNSKAQQQQQRADGNDYEDGPLMAEWEHARTPSEVAASASPEYVRALLDTIEGHQATTERLLTEIQELRTTREDRFREQDRTQREQEDALARFKESIGQLTLQLQEERERSARLLHENSVLYAQEAEQRDKVQALTALAQNRGQELHRGQGGGASSKPNRAAAAMQHRHAGNPPAPTTVDYSSLSLRQAAGGSPPSVGTAPSRREDGEKAAALRSDGAHYDGDDDDVELLAALRPATNSTAAHLMALTSEVNMLKQQLDEQRAMYERERGVRMQDARDAHRTHVESSEAYRARINELELLHESALADLISYRHRTDRDLRDVRGQVEWLKRSLHEALLVAEKARNGKLQALDTAAQTALTRYGPVVRTLRKELGHKQEQFKHEKLTVEKALAEKDQIIEDLRAEVKKARVRVQRTEERHRLEVEGVQSELTLMRQSLRQMERKVYFSNMREEAARDEENNIAAFYYYNQ